MEIVEFNESKILEYMESDDAYDYLFGGDPDYLFIDRASIMNSDPISITISFDTNEIVYCKFYDGLYTNYIEKQLNDFYNNNKHGFKQLNINCEREYQGSKPILSESQNKGFWEYKE